MLGTASKPNTDAAGCSCFAWFLPGRPSTRATIPACAAHSSPRWPAIRRTRLSTHSICPAPPNSACGRWRLADAAGDVGVLFKRHEIIRVGAAPNAQAGHPLANPPRCVEIDVRQEIMAGAKKKRWRMPDTDAVSPAPRPHERGAAYIRPLTQSSQADRYPADLIPRVWQSRFPADHAQTTLSSKKSFCTTSHLNR